MIILKIHAWLWCVVSDRALSQYKGYLSWYRDSIYKDEMAWRPSHLYNGNLYTGKTSSLYWESPQIVLNNILYGNFTDIEITI